MDSSIGEVDAGTVSKPAKVRRRKHVLPDYVSQQVSILKNYWESPHAVICYAVSLRHKGWTVRSVAKAFGVAQETVKKWTEQYPDAHESTAEYRLITGLPLWIPDLPVFEKKLNPRQIKHVPEQDAERLKELYAVAVNFRGSSRNRAEAQAFAGLVWTLHSVDGISLYQIARTLGVSNAAIGNRLRRHGYMKTKGKSVSVQPLKGRATANQKTSCARGHEYVEGSFYLMADGSRCCKECDVVRRIRYKERKKAGLVNAQSTKTEGEQL